MPPENFDVNKGPQKVFTDTVHLKIFNGVQHITFQSGKELFTFALQLPLAKGLGKLILRQIEEVEKKSGQEVKVHLPGEPLPSPWNSSDLDEGKGDTKDSK